MPAVAAYFGFKTVAAFVWAAFSYAATIAATVYSVAQQRKAKKQLAAARDSASGLLISQRDAIGTREIIYGTRRKGGTIVYMQTTARGPLQLGPDNECYQLIIALAGRKCHAMKKLYIGEDEVEIVDGGIPVSGDKYSGVLRCIFHDGDANQEADSRLMQESSGQWTPEHRLRGICYIAVRLSYNTDIFPYGEPQISALVEGAEVYDPRDGQTKFSDNPALCMRDYLTDAIVGLGASPDEIDDDSVIHTANICDELVEQKDGAYIKRYTCNGVINSADTPQENLKRLCESIGGDCVYSGGKWRIHAAGFRPVAAAFTIDDLRGPISIQTNDGMAEAVNSVKGIYASPENAWQPADFPAVENAMYLAEDKGVRYWLDMDLAFTTNANTAQRLAKIELERSRQSITVKLPLNLRGLMVDVGDAIRLPFERYGWHGGGGKLFEVIEWKFTHNAAGDDSAPALGVDIVARETAPEIYDWNAGEETMVDLAPNTHLHDMRSVGAPTGLEVKSSDLTSITQSDGTVIPRVMVSWDNPNNIFVTSGGMTRIQYKKSDSQSWIEWITISGSQFFDYITDVKIGEIYDIRIRHESFIGVSSSWAQAAPHQVSGGTNNPSPPSSVAVSATPNGPINIAWTRVDDPRVRMYGIYRSLSNDPATAEKIAEVSATIFSYTPSTTSVTTYHHWITSITGSRFEGDKSEVASIEYGVIGTVSIDPPFAYIIGSQPIIVTVLAPSGATIRYTTNTSEVTSASAEWPRDGGGNYTTLQITERTTLRVRAFIGAAASLEAVANYTPQDSQTQTVATPSITIARKANTSYEVTIQCATPLTQIYYRLEGHNTLGRTLYSGPFTFTLPLAITPSRYYTQTVVANAERTGFIDSSTATAGVEHRYQDGGGGGPIIP